MSKPIQQAVQLVEECEKQVNKLLSNPELVHNLLGINTHFRQIKARLGFMGGVIEPPPNTSKTDFPPMKEFMGSKIERAKPLESKDLNPGEAQKQQFLAKVDKLEYDIVEIDAHTILKSYTIPSDVLVLRGVAKRAGVEGFADRELTIDFIEEIQLAVELNNEDKVKKAKIDAAVNKQPSSHIATKEEIDGDPELQAMKVLPGDQITAHPDGSRTITLSKDLKAAKPVK